MDKISEGINNVKNSRNDSLGKEEPRNIQLRKDFAIKNNLSNAQREKLVFPENTSTSENLSNTQELDEPGKLAVLDQMLAIVSKKLREVDQQLTSVTKKLELVNKVPLDMYDTKFEQMEQFLTLHKKPTNLQLEPTELGKLREYIKWSEKSIKELKNLESTLSEVSNREENSRNGTGPSLDNSEGPKNIPDQEYKDQNKKVRKPEEKQNSIKEIISESQEKETELNRNNRDLDSKLANLRYNKGRLEHFHEKLLSLQEDFTEISKKSSEERLNELTEGNTIPHLFTTSGIDSQPTHESQQEEQGGYQIADLRKDEHERNIVREDVIDFFLSKRKFPIQIKLDKFPSLSEGNLHLPQRSSEENNIMKLLVDAHYEFDRYSIRVSNIERYLIKQSTNTDNVNDDAVNDTVSVHPYSKEIKIIEHMKRRLNDADKFYNLEKLEKDVEVKEKKVKSPKIEDKGDNYHSKGDKLIEIWARSILADIKLTVKVEREWQNQSYDNGAECMPEEPEYWENRPGTQPIDLAQETRERIERKIKMYFPQDSLVRDKLIKHALFQIDEEMKAFDRYPDKYKWDFKKCHSKHPQQEIFYADSEDELEELRIDSKPE